MARSWDEVIGDSDSGKNNKSYLARMGSFGQQYTDPLYWIFGKKYTDQLEQWADKSNSFLSKAITKPIGKYAGQFDPIRQNSDKADEVGDWAENKPVDSIAAVLGGVFGGGAALGGMGAGGGAAGGGAAGGGAGAAGGLGAGGTVAGFMPGSAAGGAAGLEGVTVVGAGGGAAMTPGTAAAMSAAAASAGGQASGNDWNWKKLLEQQGSGGGQQQQSQGPMQQRQPAGAKPAGSMWERIQGGLGKIGENMFPIDQAYGMNPEQTKAMRRNAIMQAGLGMMSASGGGAGFGESAAFGLGQAQQGLTGALQRGYENARESRQEERQKQRDQVQDDRYKEERDYRSQQDDREYQQQQQHFDRALKQDERSESWQRMRYDQDSSQFEQQMRLREQAAAREAALMGAGGVPSGYRRAKDGNLEPIPGGPADSANKTGNYQEAERTAAFNATRIADALKTIQEVEKFEKGSSAPGVLETGLKGLGMEGAANFVRSPQRQKANSAYFDAIDAALTLATGAAYTKEQREAMIASYMPTLTDTDIQRDDKKRRFDMLMQAARAKAGRAGDSIDKVMGTGQQAPPAWLTPSVNSALDKYAPLQ